MWKFEFLKNYSKNEKFEIIWELELRSTYSKIEFLILFDK